MLLFPRILHMGGGASRKLAQVLQTLSLRRPLLVTDPFLRQHPTMIPSLLSQQEGLPAMEIFHETVSDPTSDVVQAGQQRMRDYQPDCLIALGGGSPIDTAKAMAMWAGDAVPIIAIPTTAGTGSEMTRFAVITQSDTGEKRLLSSPLMQPTVALVDYELTLECPPRLTADTGLDALTHAVEAFVSRKRHDISDMFCREAMRLLGPALRPAYHQGTAEARRDLMQAASLAGLAFNNSSVALVHGMSRPLGAHFHWTHGASNAVLFPTVTRYSLAAAPERYAMCARALGVADATTSDASAGEALVEELRALNGELGVPTLAQSGIAAADWERTLPTMATQALASGSPQNNPRIPTHEEIQDLYRQAYEESWT
jgi:alcohol dehydrogenase class IV